MFSLSLLNKNRIKNGRLFVYEKDTTDLAPVFTYENAEYTEAPNPIYCVNGLAENTYFLENRIYDVVAQEYEGESTDPKGDLRPEVWRESFSTKVGFEFDKEQREANRVTVHTIENLKTLNEAGVPLSIDNFGKSYSNTQRLGLIQFNIIKFDKSLVKTIEQPRVAILLKKMIEVARAINVKIAVIGIETPANLSFFEKEDCDYLQGYFFTRPIPEKHLLSFLKNAREKKLTLIE